MGRKQLVIRKIFRKVTLDLYRKKIASLFTMLRISLQSRDRFGAPFNRMIALHIKRCRFILATFGFGPATSEAISMETKLLFLSIDRAKVKVVTSLSLNASKIFSITVQYKTLFERNVIVVESIAAHRSPATIKKAMAVLFKTSFYLVSQKYRSRDISFSLGLVLLMKRVSESRLDKLPESRLFKFLVTMATKTSSPLQAQCLVDAQLVKWFVLKEKADDAMFLVKNIAKKMDYDHWCVFNCERLLDLVTVQLNAFEPEKDELLPVEILYWIGVGFSQLSFEKRTSNFNRLLGLLNHRRTITESKLFVSSPKTFQ